MLTLQELEIVRADEAKNLSEAYRISAIARTTSAIIDATMFRLVDLIVNYYDYRRGNNGGIKSLQDFLESHSRISVRKELPGLGFSLEWINLIEKELNEEREALMKELQYDDNEFPKMFIDTEPTKDGADLHRITAIILEF